jgi:hypothetical protein
MAGGKVPVGAGEGVPPSPYASWPSLVYTLIAISLAIGTVDFVPESPWRSGNHSPLGYTYSLSLFLVPCALLATWLARQRHRLPTQWRAFWLAASAVTIMWCLVDVLLGNTIFTFPNAGATLGIFAPGYWPGRGWPRTIPIEEFAFYSLGSSSIMLVYIWASDSWLSAYTAPPAAYAARIRETPGIVSLHRRSVVIGVLVFLAALAWKKLGPHPYHAGFPGYFLFELVLVSAPNALLYKVVGSLVNQPAFCYKMASLLGVSLLWEVTLALPYGWWGYRPEQMIGIAIRPWFDLPIEAWLLWPLACWTNILVYEALVLYFFSKRLRGGAPA